MTDQPLPIVRLNPATTLSMPLGYGLTAVFGLFSEGIAGLAIRAISDSMNPGEHRNGKEPTEEEFAIISADTNAPTVFIRFKDPTAVDGFCKQVAGLGELWRRELGEKPDAPHGWVFYGPDGEWHWSATYEDHESVEDQRPATGVEACLAKSRIENDTAIRQASKAEIDAWVVKQTDEFLPDFNTPLIGARYESLKAVIWNGINYGRSLAADALADKQDAERWRAFYSSARFKMIGSANIDHGNYPHDMPTIKSDIAEGDWIHFGLEVWDRHEAGNDGQGTHGRNLLNVYVDHLIERRREAGEIA